jgi:hypothetical protein
VRLVTVTVAILSRVLLPTIIARSFP